MEAMSTEPAEVKHGLHVARTVLPNRSDNLIVRLMNISDKPVQLKKDTVISDLELLQPVTVNKVEQQSGDVVADDSYDSVIDDMMAMLTGQFQSI